MKQKFISLLSIPLIACFLFSCGQEGSSDKNTNPRDNHQSTNGETHNSSSKQNVITEKPVLVDINSISDIKQVYATTVSGLKDGELDSVLRKYNCNNERSGTVVYYTQHGKLKMVSHNYVEYDHHAATDQYYIQDDNIYFMYSNTSSWNFVSAEVTQDHIVEKRTYIVNNKPILCLEKKYNTLSSAAHERLEETENNEVTCPSIQSLNSDFKKLIVFKNQHNTNCLEK